MIKFKEYYLVKENFKKREFSCLMLDCSEFKTELKEIQSNIDEGDLYDEEGFGMETDPHITVLYGIHEQDPNIVKDLIELTSVEYYLDKLSLFENEDFDVLKCSVKSKDLIKLNKQVREILEYTNDYDDYIPHLTIAYLKPGKGKIYTDKSIDRSFKSNKFTFSDKDSNKTVFKI